MAVNFDVTELLGWVSILGMFFIFAGIWNIIQGISGGRASNVARAGGRSLWDTIRGEGQAPAGGQQPPPGTGEAEEQEVAADRVETERQARLAETERRANEAVNNAEQAQTALDARIAEANRLLAQADASRTPAEQTALQNRAAAVLDDARRVVATEEQWETQAEVESESGRDIAQQSAAAAMAASNTERTVIRGERRARNKSKVKASKRSRTIARGTIRRQGRSIVRRENKEKKQLGKLKGITKQELALITGITETMKGIAQSKDGRLTIEMRKRLNELFSRLYSKQMKAKTTFKHIKKVFGRINKTTLKLRTASKVKASLDLLVAKK